MRKRSISFDNFKDVEVFENNLCRSKMLMAFEETHVVLIMLRKEKQHRIQITQELDHLKGTIHAQNDEKIVHTELGAALTRAQKYITHLSKTIRYFQEKTGEYGHVIETEDGNKTWESYLSMPTNFMDVSTDSVATVLPAPLMVSVPTSLAPMTPLSSATNVFMGGMNPVGNEVVMHLLKQIEDKHQQEIQYVQTQHYWEMQNVDAYYTNLLHEWGYACNQHNGSCLM